MDAAVPQPLAINARRRDLLLFFSVLGLMLLASPRLRVYYHVTVAEVSVERITPDGQTVALPTPPEFVRPGDGYWGGDILMGWLEPRIRTFMQSSDWNRDAAPGTKFVWAVRWSDDSSKLDHSDRVTWEVPDGPPAR